MIAWFRKKIAAGFLSAAVGLVALKYIAPDFVDPLLDLGNVALVVIALKLK